MCAVYTRALCMYNYVYSFMHSPCLCNLQRTSDSPIQNWQHRNSNDNCFNKHTFTF